MSSNFNCIIDVVLNSHRFNHQVSNDFDEQASYLLGWNQNYSQVSAGAFKGFISEVHLGDVSLFWEFTSQRLYQNGVLNDDTIAIGVPLNSIDNGMFCGASCEQNSVHVYSGKNGFEFISPQNLLIGLIVVNRHKLMQLLSADDQYFLSIKCKRAHISKVSSQAYFSLVNFFKSTIQIVKSNPAITKNTHFSHELTATAMMLITDGLLNNIEPNQNSPHKSWKILAETREIVNLRQDNPITVAELCESLRMSRRSLQYHFEQAINTNPVSFLRAERLNGVRHMLKNANSVTEAATHWGFWHFGHFSHEYKIMFGELPSATFKRLHGC